MEEKSVVIKGNKPQTEYWNVMKGIGIICIVMGHCFMQIQNFVYLFHVPLFYFISGFLYNEEKYGDNVWLNLQSRMKLWVKYVLIYIPFILLHNFFAFCCVARKDEAYYTPIMMVEKWADALIGNGDEFLAGPLWFVPSLVIVSFMLSVIVFFSRKISSDKLFLKILFQLILICFLTILGYLMISRNWQLPDKMQINFTVMIYIWMGYICRNYIRKIEKVIQPVIGVILLLFLIFYSKNHLYSLIDGFISPMMFVMAFAGFYVCMSIAKSVCYLESMRWIKRTLTVCGKASFWIMALHFSIIRYLDRIYAALYGNIDMMFEHYLGWHTVLVPLYLLLGIGIPLCCYIIWNRRIVKDD